MHPSAPRKREITTRRLHAHEWRLLRELRLRALADAPHAFARTVAEERAYPDEAWRRRLEASPDAPAAAWIIAEADGDPAGIACGRCEPSRPHIADVFSMWVEPGSRRTGVACALVEAIAAWARTAGARALVLGVLPGNEPAMALYRAQGFVATDLRGPEGQPTTDGSSVMMRALDSA